MMPQVILSPFVHGVHLLSCSIEINWKIPSVVGMGICEDIPEDVHGRT